MTAVFLRNHREGAERWSVGNAGHSVFVDFVVLQHPWVLIDKRELQRARDTGLFVVCAWITGNLVDGLAPLPAADGYFPHEVKFSVQRGTFYYLETGDPFDGAGEEYVVFLPDGRALACADVEELCLFTRQS